MKTSLVINADQAIGTIDKNIYGHFAEHLGRCIYEGIWVGERSNISNTRGIRNDVVEALRRINVPVLRWPGGCFADEYHWKDGIGPREKRKKRVNTHWGQVIENNHFGTHEFLDLCEMLECEPYICGNVGSGTVREMQEWIEYITFNGESALADLRRRNGRKKPWKLRYFGVGNENWGCGGWMRPEYYADLYRRYRVYVRDYGDNKIYKIACGARDSDYRWTEVLMREAVKSLRDFWGMNGLSLHYYTIPGDPSIKRGSATDFNEEEWFITLKKALYMEELIVRHSTVMDEYDPDGDIALIVDEWGSWYDVEPGTNPGFLYQQNTLRDALVAGVTLNIFNNHCQRVKMANIAQMVNVLQALILTDNEKMVLTPTYHVFEMYKTHQDATLLPIHFESGSYEYNGDRIVQVNASASKNPAGTLHVTLCNLNPRSNAEIDVELRGAQASEISGSILTASSMNTHNTFEKPDAIEPVKYENIHSRENGFQFTLPAMSVVSLSRLFHK